MPKTDFDAVREECGIFGIYSQHTYDVASDIFYGLYALQHRGQESCGIVVNDSGLFNAYKDVGLVSEIFNADIIRKLGEGSMAIGHTNYGTLANKSRENAQPMVVNHVKGRMALAFNGNIVNALELRTQLELEGAIFHTTSDTEVISYLITKERLKTDSIVSAICSAITHLKGAFSLVVMSPTKIIALRDPRGIRPLCYGQMQDGTYVVSSESCGLDAVNAKFIRDIEAGEIVVFSKDGVKSITEHCNKAPKSLCVFEYVYFSRPDSVVDGCTVSTARIKAGKFLAQTHPVDADVVLGCPDSGIDAAIGYAKESGIPFMTGFIKNKYMGRTFISPTQKMRENQVRMKLNPIKEVVNGKRVVLVDDSIVRGTTSKRVLKLLKDAGAKEVHLRISAPPFTNPCYYGTDIDSKENLIACKYSVEETAKIIGADSLGYLTIDQVKQIANNGNKGGYCTACFDGLYPTEVPKDTAKSRFEKKIGE